MVMIGITEFINFDASAQSQLELLGSERLRFLFGRVNLSSHGVTEGRVAQGVYAAYMRVTL